MSAGAGAAAPGGLRIDVVVSHFNYGRFVGEAVDSVLAQGYPAARVLVVDDGSSDDSLRALARFHGSPQVLVLAKPNGGQLSCFNHALPRLEGELVMFLDADDLYEPGYLARIADLHRRTRFDFAYCARTQFGERHAVLRPYRGSRALGRSAARALYLQRWIGGSTSTLTLTRALCERILPVPLEEDWRLRADDVLVWGASLAGACKFYLDEPCVRYRVHGANAYFGSSLSPEAAARRNAAIERLFAHFAHRFGFSAGSLARGCVEEFASIGEPTLEELLDYARIVKAGGLGVVRGAGALAGLARAFVAGRLLRPSPFPA